MILSVSRRTDIPNYYSEWFYNRIKEGFVYVRNPMNRSQVSRITLSPEVVDCIVFWTKNPEPMLERLDELSAYHYYFQFTLTCYGRDVEVNVPEKEEKMIPVFQRLSEKIGRDRVIWRYDPVLFTDRYTPQYHLDMFRRMASALNGYTGRCVISFADTYGKTKKSMEAMRVYELSDAGLMDFSGKISEIARANGMTVGSCAERIDLSECGIEHNCCIDKKVIEDIMGCRIKVEKDKNQRPECGCVESVEIGTYNTCKNGCRYCYANYSQESVLRSQDRYDPFSPILCGSLTEEDRISQRKVKSLREGQLRLTEWFCIILFAVCFWMGMKEDVSASSEPFSFYEDGDVVGFIGDSITHVTYDPLSYMEILEEYYLSRFPGQRTEFRNVGTGGYKAADVLNIYDRDPAFQGLSKAVIMLGTNEAILGVPAEEYIADMGELVERLKNDGLKGEDILILSPPICDENCTLNRDKNGNLRWTYEDKLTDYMAGLEPKAEEWGVHYLDIHTPMVRLTEEMQKESRGNTLTTDCIHPNALGHRLIVSYILQAQGAGSEPLSEVYVSQEGDVQTVRGEVTDFYRGEKGICWTWKPDALPAAADKDMQRFRAFSEAGDILYKNLFQVEGFSEDTVFHITVGEAELGSFTGRELADGIDLGILEEYPQRAAVEQINALEKERHQNSVKYRNIWIEVAMQRAVFTQEEIQEKYEKWRSADEALRNEIYTVAETASEEAFLMAAASEGYSAAELRQEAEEARREAEEAARRAEEEAKREAEERERREAEEAKREAEEQERREAEAGGVVRKRKLRQKKLR